MKKLWGNVVDKWVWVKQNEGNLARPIHLDFSWSPSLLEIKMFVPSEDREGSSTPRSSPCFRERSASPCCTYCFSISFSLKYSTWHHICSELRHCKANMLIIPGTLEWFCEKQSSGILWHKWVMKLEPLLHYGKWEPRVLLLSCYNHCWGRNG